MSLVGMSMCRLSATLLISLFIVVSVEGVLPLIYAQRNRLRVMVQTLTIVS